MPGQYFIPSDRSRLALPQGRQGRATGPQGVGARVLLPGGGDPFPDRLDQPSRTILTGEGGTAASRFKHIIETPSGRYRRLTPVELERLNGFPDDWTANGDARRPPRVHDGQRARGRGGAQDRPRARARDGRRRSARRPTSTRGRGDRLAAEGTWPDSNSQPPAVEPRRPQRDAREPREEHRTRVAPPTRATRGRSRRLSPQLEEGPRPPRHRVPGRKVAIFVHGCYGTTARAATPTSEVQRRVWARKFELNAARDHRKRTQLAASGWTVDEFWECDLVATAEASSQRFVDL